MTGADAAGESDARRDELFWKIALKNSLVTREQVRECREIQRRIEDLGVSAKPIGDIMLEKGFVDREVHDRILAKIAALGASHRIEGYKLQEKLGQGSMGVVWRARQISLDRIVAVKILAPFLQKNERFVSRFLKEAKVLARLNHPHIVQCIDVGRSHGLYYFAMEYVDGPTVGSIVKRGGRMADERATRIILQVAMALDHAFEHSIIHRDIKPDNIMIASGGVVKLCDLGLVKDLDTGGDTTDTGTTLGTPNYISPEQARGDEFIDQRSDIYSLGATYYHMVTGVTPFQYENPAATLVAHLNEVPKTPRERVPELSAETSRIISKMLRKNPDDRYQRPSQVVADLEKHLARLTGEGDPLLLIRPRRRRRR